MYAILADGMRICYRTYGPLTGEPLLLIAGVGLQLDSWPRELIEELISRDYFVIAFDNRDVGRSSRVDTSGPSKLNHLFKVAPADNYDIGDMADDTARLIRHIRRGPVHVVGMSLGGMIGQTLAARYPELVRTFTSIFSTTGDRSVGQPAKSTIKLIASAFAPKNKEQGIDGMLKVLRHVGSSWTEAREAMRREYADQAWGRTDGMSLHLSVGRQIGAIMKSGDRTAQLKRIVAPTLVLHGDVEKMVHPSGGEATANAIKGAKFVSIQGMRHELTSELAPELAAYIDGHAKAVHPSR